eukprot:208286-Prymnesium_polylepis.1
MWPGVESAVSSQIPGQRRASELNSHKGTVQRLESVKTRPPHVLKAWRTARQQTLPRWCGTPAAPNYCRKSCERRAEIGTFRGFRG